MINWNEFISYPAGDVRSSFFGRKGIGWNFNLIKTKIKVVLIIPTQSESRERKTKQYWSIFGYFFFVLLIGEGRENMDDVRMLNDPALPDERLMIKMLIVIIDERGRFDAWNMPFNSN